MIKKIYLKNYRAFEEVNIDFSKINLFFGPNNSGKSCILSSINLLSQTLQSKDVGVALLLNGNYEELGTYADIVFQNKVKENIIIGTEFEEEINGSSSTKGKGKSGYFEVEFKLRPYRREIIVQRTEAQVPIGVTRLKTKIISTGNHKYFFFDDKGNDISNKISGGKRRFYHYVPYYLPSGRMSDKQYQQIVDPFSFNYDWCEYLEENYEYICPFREFPKRTYLFTGERPDFVGKRGEKAIEMLVMDYLTKKEHKIIDKVSRWLDQCDISSNIFVETLTPRHYEIKLRHARTSERENLADVGFGCSQILPILIAGSNLKSGQILSVEQPEIHLHPRAQSELGTFFYDLAKNNVQTLIETHSEHLLLRIQRHIAEGDLNPTDVKIYYVYADKGKNKKEIREIEMDNKGKFLTEWPEGFFPERLEEVRKIAKASLKGQ
jgi:predicted ATPase